MEHCLAFVYVTWRSEQQAVAPSIQLSHSSKFSVDNHVFFKECIIIIPLRMWTCTAVGSAGPFSAERAAGSPLDAGGYVPARCLPAAGGGKGVASNLANVLVEQNFSESSCRTKVLLMCLLNRFFSSQHTIFYSQCEANFSDVLSKYLCFLQSIRRSLLRNDDEIFAESLE